MDRGKRCCGIDLGTYKITICCRGENGAIQWMDGRVQGRNWDYSSVYYQPGKEKIPCYIPPSIHQGDVLLTDTKRFFGRCDCPEVQEDVKKVRYPVSCKHGQIGFEVPGKDGRTISRRGGDRLSEETARGHKTDDPRVHQLCCNFTPCHVVNPPEEPTHGMRKGGGIHLHQSD